MADAKKDKSSEKTSPWVPVSKRAIRDLLPRDRPYTEIEALLSLQLNHNDGIAVTVLGLAKVWGWTRKKIRVFLERANIEIDYPVETSKIKKQAGFIVPKKGPLKGHKRGHINFIDFNNLQAERDISGAIKGATFKEKENKGEKYREKPKESDPRTKVFSDWWIEKYRYKFGREYVVTNWAQHMAQIKSLIRLPMSFEDLQFMGMKFFLDDDPFIVEKAGHNLGMFIKRLGQNAYHIDDDFRLKNREHLFSAPKAEGIK